jgi:hypothetical protein
MPNVKITFKKELEIDLNTYYPNFTPGLRKQIDDALFALLGGQPKPAIRRRTDLSETTILRLTGKKTRRPNSVGWKVMCELGKGEYLYGNEKPTEYLYSDVKKVIDKLKANQSVSVGNLISGGYLEVVK